MTLSEKAKQYIGIKEGSRQHKEIIDYYNNNIKPLPRGYRVKYSDSWCMTFVSAIECMVGVSNPIYECSCTKAVDIARKNRQIVTTPKVDDIIFYDWKNNGTIDHVGIIYLITNDLLYVIEGNYANSVKVRTIKKTDKQIECYARVKLIQAPKQNDIDQLARDVIKGKYGYGKARINALGELYPQVQARVNEILSSK